MGSRPDDARACCKVRAVVTRRSLRPHLNQIRTWVRQGRTDSWIAHQLEVTVQQIQSFKREQELEPDGDDSAQFAEDVAEAASKQAEEEQRRQEEEGRAAAGAAAAAEAAERGEAPAEESDAAE